MDVDVFKQRFLPFHPKLYRIAYALLDNKADAEDILQDAYCKLWNKRDELGDIQNPEAFSITLVKIFVWISCARPKQAEETTKRHWRPFY